MLNDEQILSILLEATQLEMQCRRLVDAANEAAAKDNITGGSVACFPNGTDAPVRGARINSPSG